MLTHIQKPAIGWIKREMVAQKIDTAWERLQASLFNSHNFWRSTLRFMHLVLP